MENTKKKSKFLEKIDNFWYYYKWWVILGAVFLMGIIVAVNFFSGLTKEEPADLKIISVYSHPLTAKEYDINERVTDCLTDINGDGKINAVLKQYYITEERKTDDDQIAIGQFETLLGAGDGDVMLFDEPNLEVYIKKDIFKPLDNLEFLSEIPKEHIIYQNGVPVAVKLERSKILIDMGFIIDEVYTGVMFVPDEPSEETVKSRQSAEVVLKKLIEQ